MKNWIAMTEQLPPRGVPVVTKIDDSKGPRNEELLKLGKDNSLWWLPDDSMYVYYSPTHWRPT